MENFIELVAEVFDVDPSEISMDTVFRKDVEGFSSMTGFALLVMMEDEYGVKMPVDDFLKCETVGDLYRHCVKA